MKNKRWNKKVRLIMMVLMVLSQISIGSITLVHAEDSVDEAAPGEVSSLTAIPGDSQITLNWTDPADQDLKEIKITEEIGTVTGSVYAHPGQQTATISGLTNGNAYTFKVSTIDTSDNESPGVTVEATPHSSSATDPNSVMERIGFVGPLTGVSQPQFEVRQRDSFDFDWKFYLGDMQNVQSPDLDDSGWRILNLPHDWSIEGTYSQDNPTSSAGGYLPAGIGLYRKTFEWSPAWEGKKVSIEFDGVYMNSDVWLNGQHLGNRPYGYSSFEYDLTPYLQPGKNIIAVRVDDSKVPSGRWYTGSGIYRHTWLTVTDNLHVAHWGTYVTTPEITNSSSEVNIRTTVQNDSSASKDITLVSKIHDVAGNEVGSVESTPQYLTAGGSSEIEQSVTISNPHLWSTEDPYLYSVKTYVKENGNIVDDYYTEFGVRSFKFEPNTGFSLNGVPMKIKGMALHHDGGPVGAAVPDKVLERRLTLLKEMGVNAIRTSHNPMAPEFYSLCDRLGLMVMDEAFDGWETPKAPDDYGLYFNDWWDKDLGDMVQRDRDHPSVIMWSIGNEIPNKTMATATKLLELVHQLDPTRPVTAGLNDGGNNPYRAMLDVAGYNEWADNTSKVENDHAKYPNLPMIGTEWPHTYQTRGEYRTISQYYSSPVIPTPNLTPTEIFDTPKQYESSYDNDHTGMSNRDAWKFVKEHPYFAGFFRWTGFDYLGEANHHVYPYRHGDKGIFDLVGFPKDLYYFYKSQWTNEPVIHILPDWTHPGMEGKTIPVWAYTNCDSVELFLNGKSLGEKQMTDAMYLSWDVPYTPGELKAVGKKKASDGSTQTFVDTVVTASDPARINLYADNTTLAPDGRDISHLAFEVVDGNGNFVPNDNDLINFKILGPVTNIGMDNGDPLDLTPNKADYRKVFNGLGLGIFQSTQETGDIEGIAGGILSNTRDRDQPSVAIDVQRIALRGNLKERNLQIYYTTDGSEPGKNAQLYTGPFTINKGDIVKAAVFDGDAEIMTLGDDKTSLVLAISDAQNLDQNDYAPSAWAAVQAALQQAISVNENPQATQEMIDQATAALQAALNTNQRWMKIEDSEVTSTEGTPLNKFYYYSANNSWVNDGQHTYDNPKRTAQDYASITFTGTKIELYSDSSKNEGLAKVSIDGGTAVDVDEYYNTSVTGRLVYTSPDLPYGQHTFKVRCANQSTENPNNRSINIDYVKIRKFDPNDQTAPGEVTALTAIPGDGQVTLNWTDPADQDLKEIKITEETGSVSAVSIQPGQQTAIITGLTNGNPYTFKVTTIDASGNESAGAEVQATSVVLVRSISVADENGTALINQINGTLQMIATVRPDNATDKTVTWAVYGENGEQTDAATISADGLVTSHNDGIVKIVAKASDRSGIKGESKVMIDTTAPVTTAVANPAAPDGTNGWYRSDVTLTLTASDNLSGVANTQYSVDNGLNWINIMGPVTFAQDGKYSIVYRSKDEAGNTETDKSITFLVDKTVPAVTFSLNDGMVYSIDQTVTITCQAADASSGIGTSTCRDISAPAYTFNLGTNTVTASATDVAGNTGSSTIHFEVNVSLESLIRLVNQFLSDDHTGIANSLSVKLDNAMKSEGNAREGMLNAFKNEVSAQSGKALKADQAEILNRLADVLK